MNNTTRNAEHAMANSKIDSVKQDRSYSSGLVWAVRYTTPRHSGSLSVRAKNAAAAQRVAIAVLSKKGYKFAKETK